MDCGDAGHILVSKHVAEDLEEYERWRPFLHDLGTCEVKHGARVASLISTPTKSGIQQLPRKTASGQETSRRCAGLQWQLRCFCRSVAAAFSFLRKETSSFARHCSGKSIAVLPFENLSEEKANAFFAEGVQDEILTYLAKIADLKVISRTSVMQYKSGAPRNLREIGQQLGVAHVSKAVCSARPTKCG